jgi:hypothetical protein
VTDDGEALNRDLEQMSGNPRIARALRDSLEKMSGGAAGPVMAELARDLLAGRISLRTIGNSSAYADYFRDAAAKYAEWENSLTREEREELRERAAEQFGAPGDA